MAGLYWFFKDNEIEEILYPAFVILTTEANKKMQQIHDRMPVIISENNMEKWLTAENPDEVIHLMEPREYDFMEINKTA